MRKILAIMLTVFISNVCLAQAQTAEEKGLEIAREADRRGEGFGDYEASMKMVLSSRRGDRSERDLRVRTLEGKDGEGDKGLTIFDTPADVRGTALLSWSHADRDDD